MLLTTRLSALALMLSASTFTLAVSEEAPGIEAAEAAVAEALTEAPAQQALTEEEQYWAWARQVWDSLKPQQGEIPLPQAGAVLNVPENFYFLDNEDAERVLVEVWGNPPGQNVLGMLFPQDMTPFDDGSWGVTVEYEEDGYVSDADAGDIDYDDLLKQMQADTNESSDMRVSQGYEAIELVGWAATPFYDATTHKMHWAKELKFGEQETNTLNYNIRVLGRKGVLVLNFIADMQQKPVIEENLDSVLAMADFSDGSRYADFDPELDQVAAYGLGALVAGKVIAKTGFLAIALMFLKKFGVFILLGIGGLVKMLWGRRKNS